MLSASDIPDMAAAVAAARAQVEAWEAEFGTIGWYNLWPSDDQIHAASARSTLDAIVEMQAQATSSGDHGLAQQVIANARELAGPGFLDTAFSSPATIGEKTEEVAGDVVDAVKTGLSVTSWLLIGAVVAGVLYFGGRGLKDIRGAIGK